MSVDKLNLMGLSGYDFTGIVDSMVQMYRLPQAKMAEQQSSLQIRKDAWRDVKTRLSALETTLAALKSSSTWTATKASSSNTDLLAVTSSSNTATGMYNIKISNTAQAQTVAGSVFNVASASSATTLAAGSFSITVGGEAKTIEVADGASLTDIASSVNNAKAGVTASVIQVDTGYRLTFIANKTGTANKAEFAQVSGSATLLSDLGIVDGLGNLNETQIAEDALISVNGITNITSASNTITGVIPGLTLNLKGEDPNTTITVEVSADVNAAQEAVQKFVDQYNSVQDFIADKMSYNADTKITGDLFGDTTLQGIQSKLRYMVSGYLNNPTGPYRSLSEIGISTSEADYGKSAKLEFDTSKFTKAVSENPDSVANLFGASAGGVTPRTESTSNNPAQGLANIMKEYLHPLVMYDGALDELQDSIGRQVDDLKDRIQRFEDKALAYEERTRLKFARLEAMMAELNSQSAWLTSQVNTLTAQHSSKK